MTDQPSTPRAHLVGTDLDPAGPRLALRRSMTASSRTFYTTVEPGIRFGEPYHLVIDLDSPNAELVSARCVGVVGDEMEWEVLERGN